LLSSATLILLNLIQGLEGSYQSHIRISRDLTPPRLKPAHIPGNLRGPEGPLFHSDAGIREFFRNL
jgi:hypothetical protein